MSPSDSLLYSPPEIRKTPTAMLGRMRKTAMVPRLLTTLCSALLLSTASAQIGQKAEGALQNPLFQNAKVGRSGILTLADGTSVVLNQRGGYLLGATIVTTYTEPVGVATKTDTSVAAGAVEERVGGSARTAQLAGVLTGYGDGLSGPLLQFLRQPDVVAQLPQGVTVDAAPFTIRAQVRGRVLTVGLSLSQVPAGQFAPTKNVRPAAKPSARDVVLRVYSDFQCPYCQKFERETMPELLGALPADVRIEFHQFPLEQIHPLARPAAEASECAAEQGKFWDYKDALFQDPTWLQGNPNEAFLKLAGTLKLDTTKFKDCLALRRGKAAVDAGISEAQRLGVNGTPTVFVDGYRVSNPYDVKGLLKMVEFARATR